MHLCLSGRGADATPAETEPSLTNSHALCSTGTDVSANATALSGSVTVNETATPGRVCESWASPEQYEVGLFVRGRITW